MSLTLERLKEKNLFKDSQDSLIDIGEVNERPRILTEVSHNRRRDYDLKYPSLTLQAEGSLAGTTNTRSSFSWHASTKWLREMFLPVGYPFSVHRCYARVHVFQFIETCAASLVTVMTAEALLTAVGVSSELSNTGGAVAIQWVVTNGFGEIGKLIVIQQYSYLFDSYPKTSKLLGEVCCISGNGLHVLTLFLPDYYLMLASLGYALYGIYLSIWAATHTTFNSHLALKENNMGDLNAKDDAQVSLAHILGLICGVLLLSFSDSSIFISSVYIIFSLVQVVMTLMLVKSADYEVLNFARMRLVSHALVHRNRTLSCRNLNGRENWIGEFITLSGLPPISLSDGVREAMNDDELIGERLQVLKAENYILFASKGDKPTFKVLLREDGTGQDILRAVLHATKWATLKSSSVFNDDFYEAYLWMDSIFDQFYVELREMDWKRDALVFTDKGVRVSWER